MQVNKSKILITGGHLTPAMAVYHELKKRGFTNFTWVGHKYNQAGSKVLSAEYKTVTSNDIEFVELKTGKLVRKWTFETFFYGINQFLQIFLGLLKSLIIILKYRPELILSFGGYLAVPIVAWGKLFGAKVITHEQTIVTGLANKIISKFADKILVSWESSLKYFDKNKVVLTGNPIRRDIFIVKSNDLTKDFDQSLPTLYITGGNQGANEINKRVFEIIEKLLEDCNVIHQTGNSTTTDDFNKANTLKIALPDKLKNRYIVKDFIGENEIGEAFNKSDLIFSRAGANTISEILALGKMSILMPIPWTSHDEQTKNAKFVETTGLGYILLQKDTLTAETVYQTILLAFNQIKAKKCFNGENLDECSQKAKKIIDLDAPIKVAEEVEKILS